MNKIAITIISVLAVGVIAAGLLYWQQTNNLTQAKADITGLEGNIVTLE